MAKIKLVKDSGPKLKKTGEPKRKPGPRSLDPKSFAVAFRITEGASNVLLKKSEEQHVKPNDYARNVLLDHLEIVYQESVTN